MIAFKIVRWIDTEVLGFILGPRFNVVGTDCLELNSTIIVKMHFKWNAGEVMSIWFSYFTRILFLGNSDLHIH